ncbi:MAG TPA: hypothetical protein VHC22_31050 [Pirellulales bacterium]|nr:hypothetical protein [Pirellulales bacterium]
MKRITSPILCASALVLLMLSGCGDGIEKTYGRRAGLSGGDSVNGTAVLARMFETAGHRVTTATRLSPRVYEKADCIVWAPDDFAPPSAEVRQWFNAWWRHGRSRTLIYIGRDYDAAPDYWQGVTDSAPPGKRAEIRRRLANDQNAFLADRGQMPKEEDCEWFVSHGKRDHRRVDTLSGDAEWVSQIDAKQVEIELNGRLVPPDDAEVLVESEGDAIVSRQSMVNRGRLVVVLNGSFVLNVPLVNRENRKLAGRLIDDIGSPPQQVVFLESGRGGPPVWEDEPRERPRTSLEVLAVWPFNVIFLQLGALGLIFCYSRLPIFGRPRPLAAPPLSDFGRHIAALGTLLQRTGDRAHALNRLAHYQQSVRLEPGRYRRPAPPPAMGPRQAPVPKEDSSRSSPHE